LKNGKKIRTRKENGTSEKVSPTPQKEKLVQRIEDIEIA